MATYVNNLRLKEITTGDEDGTWGTSTNTNLELITDGFSYGTKEMAADANETFTMPDATADATRSLYLKFTSAVSLTATREITLGPNTVSKTWIIENATTGGQTITIKQGSGATVDVANGSKVMVVTDGAGAGAAVLNANPTEVGGTVTSVDVSGGTTGLTTSGGPVTSSGTITLAGTLAVANGGTGVTSSTGTGSVVLSTNPTFAGLTTTADMNFGDSDKAVFGAGSDLQIYHDGTHSYVEDTATGSLILKGADVVIKDSSNNDIAKFFDGGAAQLRYAGGIKLATTATGIDVTGTAAATDFSGSGASLTSLNAGNISSGTLAVARGGTGVTSSTGSGSVVLSTSPTLVTPVLGTPTSGNLSNCTADGTSSVGYRDVPAVGTKTTSYTLQTADVGKYVQVGSGGSITIPDATFSEGDVVSIFNNTTGSVTITCSITTCYKAGTDTDISSASLDTRGVATVLFISGTVAVITGNLA